MIGDEVRVGKEGEECVRVGSGERVRREEVRKGE